MTGLKKTIIRSGLETLYFSAAHHLMRPFVAGVGRMKYRDFITYNIIGGIGWVAACLLAGYFFGNIPVVKENFELVIIGIIVVSLLPALTEYLRRDK